MLLTTLPDCQPPSNCVHDWFPIWECHPEHIGILIQHNGSLKNALSITTEGASSGHLQLPVMSVASRTAYIAHIVYVHKQVFMWTCIGWYVYRHCVPGMMAWTRVDCPYNSRLVMLGQLIYAVSTCYWNIDVSISCLDLDMRQQRIFRVGDPRGNNFKKHVVIFEEKNKY